MTQDELNNFTREVITKRFMHCVKIAKIEKRRQCTTDSQIGAIIGVPQQTIAKYRAGLQGVTIEQLARFCHEFQFDPRFILLGTIP